MRKLKGPWGGGTFVEGHQQNFNYHEIFTWRFRGWIILHYSWIKFSPITFMALHQWCNFLQFTLPQQLFLLSKAQTLLLVSYIIFFALEVHFCPLSLPAKGKEGAEPPLQITSSGMPDLDCKCMVILPAYIYVINIHMLIFNSQAPKIFYA